MQYKLRFGFALSTLAVLASCSSPWNQKKSSDDAPSATSPIAPIPQATQAAPAVPAGGAPDEMGSVNKSTITNLDDLIAAIRASSWHDAGAHCAGKTIAIFDNGFSGLEDSKGLRLPPNLVVEASTANAAIDTPHGTKLTEIIWAICTGSRVYSPARPGPTLKLFNTNGYTNLANAVDAVAKTPVDIVLYSQVWEFGGNFDGKGFINSLVNKVTSRNILWVNAAGNYGQTSWQNVITFNSKNEVTLPHEGRYLRFAVNDPQTLVKLTLAWNDFGEDKNDRTSQDLDLILEDSKHKQIAIANLVQDGQDHKNASGFSAFAREQMTAMLEPGIYFLRITSPKPSIFNATSRLRLGADGKDVVFIDQTPEASIMIPADNPSVLTVGASDVDFSSAGTVIGTNSHKPEILAPSILNFDNGMTYAGSSSAAAVAAAAIALYESKCGVKDHAQWLRIFSGDMMGTKALGMSAPTIMLPDKGQCL